MTRPPPAPLRVSVTSTPPKAELYLSSAELAAAAGISLSRLARLIRLGMVEPPALVAGERGLTAPVFPAAAAARLRRIRRLHEDLGVNFAGAVIIVDLLERLHRLEAELAGRRGNP